MSVLPVHSPLFSSPYNVYQFLTGMGQYAVKDALNTNNWSLRHEMEGVKALFGDGVQATFSSGRVEGMECSAGTGLAINVNSGSYLLEGGRTFAGAAAAAAANQTNAKIYLKSDGSFSTSEPTTLPNFCICTYNSNGSAVTSVTTNPIIAIAYKHADKHIYGGEGPYGRGWDEIRLDNLRGMAQGPQKVTILEDGNVVGDYYRINIGTGLGTEIVGNRVNIYSEPSQVPAVPTAHANTHVYQASDALTNVNNFTGMLLGPQRVNAYQTETHTGVFPELHFMGTRGVRLFTEAVSPDRVNVYAGGNAADVGVLDSAAHFTTVVKTVEAILAELATSVATHNLLSTAHADTTAASPTTGQQIYADASKWKAAPVGTDLDVWQVNGSEGSWGMRPASVVVTVTGNLSVSTRLSALKFRMPRRGRIIRAHAEVVTAPTGANVLIDINLHTPANPTGISIWNTIQNNRLTIPANSTFGDQTTFDTTTVNEGDFISFDCDQIGSGVSSANLCCSLDLA